MTDKPDNKDCREQSAKGYDGRYVCLVAAVVCVLLAAIDIAAALVGKGFPNAIGYLEVSAFLMIAAAVASIIAAVGFFNRSRTNRDR
jgi:hypothetical protein